MEYSLEDSSIGSSSSKETWPHDKKWHPNLLLFFILWHAALFDKILAYYEMLVYYALLGGILAYSPLLDKILAHYTLLVVFGKLCLTWSHPLNIKSKVTYHASSKAHLKFKQRMVTSRAFQKTLY